MRNIKTKLKRQDFKYYKTRDSFFCACILKIVKRKGQIKLIQVKRCAKHPKFIDMNFSSMEKAHATLSTGWELVE